MTLHCPLCADIDNGPAPIEEEEGYRFIFTCVRCGRFEIERHLATGSHQWTTAQKLRLSGSARASADEGQRLHIRGDNYEQLVATAPVPPTFGAYIDRLIEQLAKQCGVPGRDIGPCSLRPLAARLCVATETCNRLLLMLHEAGLIIYTPSSLDYSSVALTLKGVERADAITRLRPREDRAFVAMWFDDAMRPAYAAMKAALQSCGYQKPFRVDDAEYDALAGGKDFTTKIDDRIIADIRRARFVVADATGARPAVYYEAGFAEGLGTPVIWTCRADGEKDMSFDTRQVEHIIWTDAADLEAKLSAKIRRRGWDRTAS